MPATETAKGKSMLIKILSGGQTGADQAGLRAARAAGLETGGTATKGYLTEAGPAPWLADYGLREHASKAYPPRTRANVVDADATLSFESSDPEKAASPGSALTYSLCESHGKPFRGILMDCRDGRCRPSRATHSPADIAAWIRENSVRVLNVAGNRESKAPGIGAAAETFLVELFALLKEGN